MKKLKSGRFRQWIISEKGCRMQDPRGITFFNDGVDILAQGIMIRVPGMLEVCGY